MGKSSKKSQPAAPDPVATAQQSTLLDRIDTFDAGGSGVRHGYTDANGNFVAGKPPAGMQSAQKYVESPWEAQLRALLEPSTTQLTKDFIADNVNGMPDPARVKDRSTVANDIFNRNFSLIAPAMEQSQRRLLTNLQARGLPVGSEAFNEAYSEQLRETQNTIARMGMDANIAAGDEQTRLFNLDQAQRSGALAEIAALMGGSYQPPQALPSGSGAGSNYAQLVGDKYAADMNAYNAKKQSNSSAASTIGSLGAAAIMKCSMEYKRILSSANPAATQRAVMGMPVLAWHYLPEHAPEADGGRLHVGPMAEHFHALTGLGDGKTIDTVDAFGVLLSALQGALLRIERLEAQLDIQPQGMI